MLDKKIKVRNSNLEMLRIISMLLIVMSHSDDWMGLARLYSVDVCINKFITDWLHIGGQIGVGCFLLISGYFMVKQQISLKKILKIVGSVWFYSISIWCIYLVVNLVKGNMNWETCITELIMSLFPILFSHYWFVTAYIILMILSPFFNKIIYAMDKMTYKKFLVAIVGIFVIVDGWGCPNFLPGMSEGRLIPVFITYFVAGYIRLYANSYSENVGNHLRKALLGYLLLCSTFLIAGIVGKYFNNQEAIYRSYVWRNLNSPIVFFICIELFFVFIRIKPREVKRINLLAKSCFGVYLIHSNRIVMSIFLPYIFPVYKVTNSLQLIVCSIGSIMSVYIVASIIDIVRQMTIERLWMNFVDKWVDNAEEKIIKNVDKLIEKF